MLFACCQDRERWRVGLFGGLVLVDKGWEDVAFAKHVDKGFHHGDDESLGRLLARVMVSYYKRVGHRRGLEYRPAWYITLALARRGLRCTMVLFDLCHTLKISACAKRVMTFGPGQSQLHFLRKQLWERVDCSTAATLVREVQLRFAFLCLDGIRISSSALGTVDIVAAPSRIVSLLWCTSDKLAFATAQAHLA
jgi:hypothetical protein